MKLKTNKAAAKRFRFSATGKVKFKRQGLRHCLSHRRRKEKVALRHGAYLNSCDTHRIEGCLPYGR